MRLLTALAVVLTFALGACAPGGGVISRQLNPGYYELAELGFADSRGGIPVAIANNPFSVPDAQLRQEVAASMYRANVGPVVRFLPEPLPESGSPYHVVLLFDPAPGVSSRALCRDLDQPTKSPGERLEVMAAFCASEREESSSFASIARPGSPEDPTFRRLVREATLVLFLPQRFDNDDERPRFLLH